MLNETYKRMNEKLAPSPALEAAALQALAERKSTARRMAGRRWPARKAAAAALAVALVLTLTVSAVAEGAFRSVSEAFVSLFGDSESQVEIIERLGRPVAVSDSNGGVAVTAEALLSDGEYFVVLYTVSRDDGEPLAPADSWEEGSLRFGYHGGDSGTPERPVGWASPMGGFTEYTPGETTASYLGFFFAPNGLPETYSVYFGSLEYWNGDATEILPLTGTEDPASDVWHLEIPLAGSGETGRELPSENESFSRNGADLTVTGVRASPISVTVDYEVASTKPSEHANPDDADLFIENMSLILRKKDGSEIDLSLMDDGFGNILPMGKVFTLFDEDKYVCTYGGLLSEIVPMEDMDCVIFNGVEYPVYQ